VSGDFYWFNELNLSNGCELKYLAAVDCTGHGVPGAFMSIIGHTSLNQAIIEHGKINPSEILEETNKILSDTLRQNKQESDVKDGMDIALCCFDFKNNLVQFSGAYNPLWIIKKGSEEIIEIKADKHPIGSFWDDAPKSFTNHVISLEKGDTVYFFSDGFSDQFGGPNGKKYKPKQFKEVLLSVQSKPLKEQKKVLESSMENWKGALEQIDDILVMGVRI
jgi:serine phosphatase RsbU (regulator of sigma subunit)